MSTATELLREVLTYANRQLPASVATRVELYLNEQKDEDGAAYYKQELEHFREAYVRAQERNYALEHKIAQLYRQLREAGKSQA